MKELNKLKKLEMAIGRYLPREDVERLIGKKTTQEFINEKILEKVKKYYVISSQVSETKRFNV
jgi:uncharacterized membrane protein YdjX (TVP38/TMEM64 family)